ncbi:MAG TPA: zinc-binding dehydrogenase [Bauldia sp.]|nr:zinc-binding dehydrogenase [Bauldia sp.]
MKAAVLRAFGTPLVIEEIAAPPAGPDDIVIDVKVCGIDGTDLKLLDGFGYTPDLPFIMGHEAAGIVSATGARVTALKPGDRVLAYNFLISPGSRWFQSDREQLASDMTGVVGVKNCNGGYAEKLVLPAYQVVPVPDGVAWHDAAVHADAGLTAFHAVRRSRLTFGETALVIGAGGVGSFAIQYAKLAGATVVVAERTAEKREWARRLGADDAVSTDSAAETLRKRTDGRGVDCVLDLVGTEATMSAAMDAVAAGGRIVIVGYTPDTLPLSGRRLAQNEIEVIGSRGGSRKELAAALALTAAGQIRSIVTDRAPLDQVNQALAKLRRGEVLGRLVLDVAREP